MPDSHEVVKNPDVILIDDVARKLADLGLPVQSIAQATGRSESRVEAAITYHRPNRTPEETELADDLRRLTHAAVKKAAIMLEFGPTEQKLAIIKSVLGSATRQAAAEPAGGHDELRVQFETMMNEVRDVGDVPSLSPHATPALSFVRGGDDDATTEAPTPTTDDQDEIPGDEEVRFGLRPPDRG